MGGIKPHRKGIQITFYWNGERYRPTLRIESTATNLKYASRLKAEIENAIARGTYTLGQYAAHFPTSKLAQAVPTVAPEKTLTFAVMAEKWDKIVKDKAHSTKIKYKQASNFWVKHLGKTPITEVKYTTIAALSNSNGWSPKHRNNMLIALRGIMGASFIDGEIDVDPSKRIKNSKLQKKRPDPFDVEEVSLIINHIKKTFPMQIYNAIEFALFTGIRPSELISLRWGDIDFRKNTARVERARTFGVEHATKTYSIRDIELNNRALAALLRQKGLTFMKDGYVFENPTTNKPFPSEKILRESYWKPMLRAIKLRDRVFYQTRHTFATINLMGGADQMWVATQLGHTDTQMLHRVYSTWIPGADKNKERSKMDTMFTDIATKTPPKENLAD